MLDIDDDMESIGSSDDESGSIQAEWDLVNQLHNRRFQAAEYVYNLHFNQEVRGSIADILGTIHEMLEKFLDDVKSNKNMQESDFIRLVIISPELREPIAIPWVLVRDLDVDAILEFIQKVIQSNDNFYLHKGVTFVVKHIRNPNGGGHSRKDPLDNDDFVMFKRGLVSVSKKDDDLCFGKAIVKALYHKNGPLHNEKANSIRCERGILMLLTKELYAKAGVKEGKVSSEEYCKFQEVLSKDNIRLMVYSMRYSNSYIFKGPEMEHTIYLYHYDEHYAVISSMKAFLNRSYFCSLCLVGYNNKDQHHCEGLCIQCKTELCDAKATDDERNFIKCKDCKYQRYILTRCSVNLLVVFNTMVLKRVFFVIINTCVALI